ncbi:MAG: DUF362 domain-containing protein [Bacteroidales bacterium]|nr:DUF362 domain-containing protein [Bacteroidales bacterium]
MTRSPRILIAAAIILTSSCGANKAPVAPISKTASTVYMTREISPEALVSIYEALGVKPDEGERVAVKISTGEPGGHNFLQPSLIGKLVAHVNGTIVECNTAYGGKRGTTEEHLRVAREHGFMDIADVDIMDSEGSIRLPVKDESHIRYDLVGSHIQNYGFMVNLAHFKGHMMGGFGGVLKNQSIGVASADGKVYLHSAGKIGKKNGFLMGVATTKQDSFLESMAAAAQAVHDYFGEGNIVYINVMNNLSVDCDCDGSPADPEMKDIGILASTDPVALDQACLDLIFHYPSTDGDDAKALIKRIESRHGVHIVEHAEAIGLGSRKYNLVDIQAM